MTQEIKIIWFRRDLRLIDNEALFHALKSSCIILPIFILDDYFTQSWEERSSIRSTFLAQSLVDLKKQFANHNIEFHILKGNALFVIKDLMLELAKLNYKTSLFFNEDVQIKYGVDRDDKIINFCLANSFEVNKFRPSFLKADLLASNDIKRLVYEQNQYLQSQIIKPNFGSALHLPFEITEIVNKLKYKTDKLENESKTRLFINSGIDNANLKLDSFLDSRHQNYHTNISYPYLTQMGATSHLSPFLTFGALTTKQVFWATNNKIKIINQQPQNHYPKSAFSLKSFLDRIKWRDRFTSKLWQKPSIEDTNKHYEFDEIYNFKPLNDQKQEYYQKWMNGQTGFALIDASMTQLKNNGWINFRLRAMNATFLCINCGVPWQYGAKHFMNYLIDGDVAIDSWQWQMQAGVTDPLSNTFRIYNPDKNLVEKDKDLKYVHHWLPNTRNQSLDELVNNENYDHLFGKNNYYPKMLSFEKTRISNGSIVSGIRKKVRDRILSKIQEKDQI